MFIGVSEILKKSTENTREFLKLELQFKKKDLEKVAKALTTCPNGFNLNSKIKRQIEAKALRKMRHPTRLRQLQGFLDSETIEYLASAGAN